MNRLLADVETKLDRSLGRFVLLGQENARLKRQLEELLDELEELRQENLAKGREIEALVKDRVRIRSHVQRIRENIATLEKPVGGSVP